MAPGNTEEGLGGSSDAIADAKLSHQASEDSVMNDAAPENDVLATPQQLGYLMIPGSVSVGHRPQTRSMTRGQAVKAPTIFNRLQAASSRPKDETTSSSSKLEDSQDIEYSSGGYQGLQETQSPKENVNVNQGGVRKVRGGRVRKSPRFRLKTDLHRDSTPENKDSNTPNGSASPTPRKRRRIMASNEHSFSLPLRRSSRLSKPLTEFQKYPDLPNELKFAIWEAAACQPRLVYIRNRNAPNHSYDVQNAVPTWFDTDAISAQIASERYRKMFALHGPADARTEQYVNPEVDIVLLEPCCSGCRMFHCARYQFTDMDRLAIRRLAVQTESPSLLPNVWPCWATISMAWPNVETLYLVQTAIKGVSKHEKAIIRIAEQDRERDLRKRFDEWKKVLGKDRVMSKLEFVTVVPKETANGQPLGTLYKDVAQRLTGGCEDIILG